MEKVSFVSAQHVKIEFELASIIQRGIAYIIDSVIGYIYLIIVIFALLNDSSYWMGNMDTLMMALVLFVNMPIYLYKPLMEYFFNGQTLGKMVVGIRMVRMNGDRLSIRDIFIRWVMRGDFFWISLISNPGFIGLIPLISVFDLFIASLTPLRQRMGDMLASTIAIRTRPSRRYRLKDVLALQRTEKYIPVFEKVISFTDEDMLYLKNVLEQYKKYKGEEVQMILNEVTAVTVERLELEEEPKNKTKFLEQVLKDYVFLTR